MFSLDDHFTSAMRPRAQLIMQLTCIGSFFDFAGAPTLRSLNMFAALSASGWGAFDFFLRHPQPRTIALRVSSCDVKSGALSDDGLEQTCEGPTSSSRHSIAQPGEENAN